MSEEQIVQETPLPRTREGLTHDLREIGIIPGMTVMVHSSLRSLGWVSGGPVAVVQGSPIIEDGKRVWKIYRDIEIDSDIFPEIGAEFEQWGQVKIGQVGSATTRLLPQRAAVDFAVQWFASRRAQ